MLHHLTSRPTRLARRVAAIVLASTAVVVFLSLGTDAGAQTNYPMAPTIVVTDANGTVVTGSDEVTVGQDLTVTATGWLPGTPVTITFDCPGTEPTALGTFPADANGSVRQHFNVPADAAGRCSLVLSGLGENGNPRSVQAPILVKTTVLQGSVASVSDRVAPAKLARTGLDVWQLVTWAFTSLAVGTVLVLAVRRRNETRVAS